MDESVTIPVMVKAASLMEVGPNGNNLAASAASHHPVDDLQRRLVAPSHDLDHVRHIYGSGLAMRLATEQKIALEYERSGAHGIPVSNVHRDIVTGNDVKLDFSDYLSLPQHRPDLSKENPHKVMEYQLGM